MGSGAAGVGREFSSGFGDGERRKMDVCEDFEGIVELDEVDRELLRAGSIKKKSMKGGHMWEKGLLPGDGVINRELKGSPWTESYKKRSWVHQNLM
jgi:hypothetical protein